MTLHRVDAEIGSPPKSLVSRGILPLVILALLILLGYWLRVHNLDAFSFWTDEGLTPERSSYPVAQILRNEILIQGFITKDTHPPLYYLVIHAARSLFGLSDFAFRYPSVLFGVLFIPLIYQFGRRLKSVRLGLVVALLAAVNPLQVYYSQEARMYTLLVLLISGMSYVLWRTTPGQLRIKNEGSGTVRRAVARHLLLYGALAALAVYTHYTAVFIVAAQGLFWVWILWRAGLKRIILAAAALAILVAAPLAPYTVPRLLTGAEANYYYVSPLTMLVDVVRFFHLGLTVDFARPIIIALNALAFTLLLVGLWASAKQVPRALFLLSWLLAPVLGLMLGSLLFKPMYQGVRHIMAASPAFLLLLGFGLVQTGHMGGEGRSSRNAVLSRVALPVALLLVLTGSTYALHNLYTNPAYVKDDFRAIVRFIETRAGDRDVIVYNNAVLLPLHEHYRLRSDLPATALPVYPQFATGQEPELAELAASYDHIWFITDPPADGRDDDTLIRGWLDDNQTVVINQLFPARTTEARVVAYLTHAGDDEPLNPVDASWPAMPHLTGARFNSLLTLPTLWVELLWRGERPAADASLLFTLTGPDGVEHYRESRSWLPTKRTRWDDAGIRLSYALTLPPGLPPGSYNLAVAPDGQGAVILGRVAVAPTSDWPVAPEQLFGDELALRRGAALEWPDGLSLAAVVPWDDVVLPGNNLPITLYWRVGPDGVDLTGTRYQLELLDHRGRTLRSQEAVPGAPWLGLIDGGALLREATAVYIRPDTAPGDYRLRWTLLDGDIPVGKPRIYGHVTVKPWPLTTTAPSDATVSGARFGDAIQLYSYILSEPADSYLHLTLYWQALAQPSDYTVFVHLVDEAGQVVSQVDSVPISGARPTTGWRAREIIADEYGLPIPDDLPSGRYFINIGLYNPDDGTRPTVTLDGTPQPDNQLRLAALQLPWDGGEP